MTTLSRFTRIPSQALSESDKASFILESKMMSYFKAAATEAGYYLYFDKRVAMWALTKDGKKTQYFTSYSLLYMGLQGFKEKFH